MKTFNASSWIKSGFYSISSRISVLIFGFGSFYFLIRFLSKSDFGAWSIFLTITTIVEMSRNGLIQNALIKLLHSHDLRSESKIVTASWIINSAYSIFVYLILVLFSKVFKEVFGVNEIEPMFIYFGITMVLLIPISQYNYLQQAKFSFSGIFWTAFVRQGFFFLIVVVCFFSEIRLSLVALVLVQAGCTFLGLIVAYFTARKYANYTFDWDFGIAKKVFHFGKYVMGTNISSLFFKSVDQFSVGYFLNASSVALYSSAMRLSNMIEYPATSIAEVVYPYSTAKIYESGEHVTKSIYEKSVGLTLTITLPIVIITFIFADFIIYIIAGSGYSQSAEILRVTILFGLITPFNRQFGMAMDSSNRPHLNFLLLLFALVINIISNVICIHYLGLIGAAYGTLFSYVIISIIGHLMLVKYFKVRLFGVYHAMIAYYKQGFDLLKAKLLK
jgi:lipopolysaccharide exporter